MSEELKKKYREKYLTDHLGVPVEEKYAFVDRSDELNGFAKSVTAETVGSSLTVNSLFDDLCYAVDQGWLTPIQAFVALRAYEKAKQK